MDSEDEQWRLLNAEYETRRQALLAEIKALEEWYEEQAALLYLP